MKIDDVLDRVERSIEAIEEHSAAEVVVNFSKQATHYRDLDLLWGFLFAVVILAAQLWSKLTFEIVWIIPNILVAGFLGYFLSSKWRPMKKMLLTGSRIAEETQKHTQSSFVRLSISLTTERTGLLVQVYQMERRLVLLPDAGLTQKLSPAIWEKWNQKYGQSKSDGDLFNNLFALLEEMKEPMWRRLPRRDDDINELPNRPIRE